MTIDRGAGRLAHVIYEVDEMEALKCMRCAMDETNGSGRSSLMDDAFTAVTVIMCWMRLRLITHILSPHTPPTNTYCEGVSDVCHQWATLSVNTSEHAQHEKDA